MLEERHALFFRQPRLEKRSPFALRESRLARAAIKQAQVVALTVTHADGQICGAALSLVGALWILAAEAREVVQGESSCVVSSLGSKRLRCLSYDRSAYLFSIKMSHQEIYRKKNI